ncbi:MAG: Octaprenyl diphosphate synthase [Methanobacteriota archaeon]|mgnify:FL=1|nr:octaprenyl diphosphate synthase [Euryarchaeota archaeon]CAI8223313.1 MAG: Octaprenyl diphosphate synthase [Euryarchaeota archaeon]
MVELDALQAELSSRRDIVENALEELVQSELAGPSSDAMRMARSILMAGGKRWRPVLTLLAHEAAGGDSHTPILDLALSFELIHTATLVHDDLNDGARLRRGAPTLHTTYGDAEAIVVGDYLFAIGFGLGAKSEDRIVDAVMRTCSAIAAGELKQMNHIRDLTTRPEDYDEIVRGKTAGPFSIACGSAAVVAGASEEVVAHLEAFGMGIGIAFQMVDDLLDLTGDVHMGKPRGTDVHEGKMTLPLIHALTMLHGESRNRIAEILADFNDSHWDELLLLLEEAGSLEYTMNLIETQLMIALDHLRSLPESPARRLMEGLAEISIGRRV